jgi:8-oxo-dGTP pyrophosphatase MutT (NUDIX family)
MKDPEGKKVMNSMSDGDKATLYEDKGAAGFSMSGGYAPWRAPAKNKKAKPFSVPKISALEPGASLGDRLHEDMHDIFGQVAEKHGQGARLALATNLFYAIPRSHGGDVVRKLAGIYSKDYSTKDLFEESIAYTVGYLNDKELREGINRALSHPSLNLDPKTIDKSFKAANHWLRSASRHIDHTWLSLKRLGLDKNPKIKYIHDEAKSNHFLLGGTKVTKSEGNLAVSLIMCYDEHSRLLLGKRNDNGKWTLPGGHIDQGEDPVEAAYRELSEETGLLPISLSHLTVQEGSPTLHVFSAHVVGTPTGKNDPDKECDKWQFVDTTDGTLPKNIYDNLHGPESVDENVVKRFFDKRLKKSDRIWLDVGFCDLLKVEDPEDEVACLLKHPNPAERALALKLNSVQMKHIIAAAFDPHHKVWQAALAHPMGHMAALAIAASTRDASGKLMWDRHDHLLRTGKLDKTHLEAMKRGIEDDASIPEDERVSRLDYVRAHEDPFLKLEKAEQDEERLLYAHYDATRRGTHFPTNHEGESPMPHLQGLAQTYKSVVDGHKGTPEALPENALGGAHTKAIYPLKNDYDEPAGNIIVKNHHAGEEGIDGWAEQTSQALYHAGGIGDLHQKVVPVKHGRGEYRVPGVAIFTEPGEEIRYAGKLDPKVKEEGSKIVLMDFLTGNHDRHSGNLLVKKNKSLLAIDHGDAFQNWNGFMAHANQEGMNPIFGRPELGGVAQKKAVNDFRGAFDWWRQNSAAIKAEMARRMELHHNQDSEIARKIRGHFYIRSRWLDTMAARYQDGSIHHTHFNERVPGNIPIWELEAHLGAPMQKAMHEENPQFLESNGKKDIYKVPGGDWHKNLMNTHPESVKFRAGSFESNVNKRPDKIKPIYTQQPLHNMFSGEKPVVGGEQMKHLFQDDFGNKTLVKPFTDASDKGEELGGWKEMASQAMYHAGGIGHLHQQVSIHEHKSQDGETRPFLAIHMTPGLVSAREAGPVTGGIFGGEAGPLQDAARVHLKNLKTNPSMQLPYAQILAMDHLEGNPDRNDENVNIDPRNGAPLAIDHGRAFRKHLDFIADRNMNKKLLPQYEQPHHVFTKTPGLKEWWDGAKGNIMKAFNEHVQHLPEEHRNEFMKNINHNFNELEKKFNRVD